MSIDAAAYVSRMTLRNVRIHDPIAPPGNVDFTGPVTGFPGEDGGEDASVTCGENRAAPRIRLVAQRAACTPTSWRLQITGLPPGPSPLLHHRHQAPACG